MFVATLQPRSTTSVTFLLLPLAATTAFFRFVARARVRTRHIIDLDGDRPRRTSVHRMSDIAPTTTTSVPPAAAAPTRVAAPRAVEPLFEEIRNGLQTHTLGLRNVPTDKAKTKKQTEQCVAVSQRLAAVGT